MAPRTNEYQPQTVSHPGQTLMAKLEELGMGPKEFAIRTAKPEKTISAILNGSSSITPDMAVQFETVLQIPASFWLRRQSNYDEALARQKHAINIQQAVEWAKEFPYSDMVKKGWVHSVKSIEEKAEVLLSFFGMTTAKAFEDYYFEERLKVSFRFSLKTTKKPYAFAAWLRKGELDATQQRVPEFSKSALEAKLPQMKKIMAEHPDDFHLQLQNICNSAGLRLVYTPCLTGAPVHGSSRWIGNNPLIQLSNRHKRNDIFWFTFFHELGHILKHGKKLVTLEEVDYDEESVELEREADAFAIKWTFSEREEQEVIAKLNADELLESDVVEFAEKFGTHPAMIIGRLQHKKLISWSKGNQFLVPVEIS